MAIDREILALRNVSGSGPEAEAEYRAGAATFLRAVASSENAMGILRDLQIHDSEYELDVDLRMAAIRRAVDLEPGNLEVLEEYKDYLDFVGGPDFPEEKARVRSLIALANASS